MLVYFHFKGSLVAVNCLCLFCCHIDPFILSEKIKSVFEYGLWNILLSYMEENFASIASAISSSAAHTLQGDNLKLLDEVCLVLIFFKRASSEVDFPMSSSDHCGHFELRSCGTSKKKKKKGRTTNYPVGRRGEYTRLAKQYKRLSLYVWVSWNSALTKRSATFCMIERLSKTTVCSRWSWLILMQNTKKLP